MSAENRIIQIKSFLEKTPNDPFLIYALGVEYVGLSDFEKAEEIYKGLLTSHPDYFATYYQLAKVYEALDQDDLAEKTYELGMHKTEQLGEKHAYSELKSAYEELIF